MRCGLFPDEKNANAPTASPLRAGEIPGRGPKEGFTENLRTNTALIRRKFRSPDLWVVNRKIGRISQTEVAVMYLHGVANDCPFTSPSLRFTRKCCRRRC
ncbi:spore germination protein [Cohnella algarum]|uniref:spore germination protein n=1 Tax=Cohnella algarum TaxID=2044859 RepID=UPI003B82F12C